MNVTSTALTHVTHGQEIAIQAVFVTFSLLYATLMLAFIVPIGHMTFMCARAAQQRLSTSSIARKYALFLMPVAAEVFLVIRVAYYLLIVSKSFSATAAGEARINGPDLGVPPAGTLLWGISNVVAVLMFFAQVILWVQSISSPRICKENPHTNLILFLVFVAASSLRSILLHTSYMRSSQNTPLRSISSPAFLSASWWSGLTLAPSSPAFSFCHASDPRPTASHRLPIRKSSLEASFASLF